jgi:RNA polymerase sigma-70 factor (ECF subfamily)
MAAHAEVRARVEAELRQINEPFRTVLVLRDIQGLAYEEIAEILNVNLGTVKSRLMRGRTQLKARLAPFAEAAAKRPVSAVRQPVAAVACVEEAP